MLYAFSALSETFFLVYSNFCYTTALFSIVFVLICLTWTRCYAFSNINVRSLTNHSQVWKYMKACVCVCLYIYASLLFFTKQQSCINYLWFEYQTCSTKCVCVFATKEKLERDWSTCWKKMTKLEFANVARTLCVQFFLIRNTIYARSAFLLHFR